MSFIHEKAEIKNVYLVSYNVYLDFFLTLSHKKVSEIQMSQISLTVKKIKIYPVINLSAI